MGWLARQFGMACDNVVSFELVTSAGEVLHASEDENPELYWGLRGGGGNFGIVTEFEFRLHPMSGQALLVDLFFRLDAAQQMLCQWRDLAKTAPREATLTAWTGIAGESLFMPSELNGQPIASIGYVWVGDPVQGRKFLPPRQASSQPVAHRILEMTYVELQRIDDTTVEQQGLRRYWKGHYFNELPDEAIRAFLTCGLNDQAGKDDWGHMAGASMQSYGGAIADVPDDATAFSHRDALVECVISARWQDPAEDEKRKQMARGYAGLLEPFASGGYVHAVADEGQAGTQRAYSEEKLRRLTALKDKYDPENVFHRNTNVQPSHASGTDI
jgi:FAD/FMN-containing dehydrogenase